jgi:hypothetical protein
MEGESAAARENTQLYAITAYRLMSPPMELPAMKVLARLRMVGKRLSISGLKTQQSHSMYCFPFPGR